MNTINKFKNPKVFICCHDRHCFCLSVIETPITVGSSNRWQHRRHQSKLTVASDPKAAAASLLCHKTCQQLPVGFCIPVLAMASIVILRMNMILRESWMAWDEGRLFLFLIYNSTDGLKKVTSQ
jgi:hypothetical protein